MQMKNDQLATPVGTKSFHAAGCNGIEKVDRIVLEKDRFASRQKFFARQFGDLSTFGDGKISKEFNLLDRARNAIKSSGGSRSHPPYPRRASMVFSIRFSDSRPGRPLSCHGGSSTFGNGRE